MTAARFRVRETDQGGRFLARAWATALRTVPYNRTRGVYMRCHGTAGDPDTAAFCAVGVLLDVIDPLGWVREIDPLGWVREIDAVDGTGWSHTAIDSPGHGGMATAADLLGWDQDVLESIARANDRGVSWERIADAIEDRAGVPRG